MYVHEVLVNRLGGLSLPRKSVVRLTDRPDMTLDVYRGRKTTKQQQIKQINKNLSLNPPPLYSSSIGTYGTQFILIRNKMKRALNNLLSVILMKVILLLRLNMKVIARPVTVA